ncbi:MAG: HAMP domain-containing sensor histidine kinase [Candidatus Omnitrophota bacterium]
MEDIGSLKRFAGRVAHDFNNVLTGVLGFTQLILMDINEEDKHYSDLKDMESAAKRGKALTGLLLSFSEEFSLAREESDINEIINSSIETAKTLIRPEVTIKTELSDVPTLNVDKEKIDRALTGMIVNSSKAIEGDGDIYLATKLEGNNVVISVADNGKGAGPEDLPFMFEPLYRTSEMRTTGIELTIAYDIIKAHGGDIIVLKREEGGVAFDIKIPV